MNGPKNTSFADRLSAAANAKKAQLERAARARSAAESPAAVEQRAAREAVGVAREARIAERKATKLAIEARQAAALAAALGRRIPARDRFAPDSPLEGAGFELSVPREGSFFSRPPPSTTPAVLLPRHRERGLALRPPI
jgi:Family of unknown function (DUF6481)